MSSDGAVEFVSNGTTWLPLVVGTPGTQPPLVAAFTAIGSGATFTDSAGTIVGTTDGTATDTLGALVLPRPAGGGVTLHVRTAVDPSGGAGIFSGAGLITHDSVGGRASVLLVGLADSGGSGTQITVGDWSSLASFAAGPITVPDSADARWLRFFATGGTEHFQISADGDNWRELLSRPTGTWVPGSGDQVGVVIATQGASIDVWDSVRIA